MNETKQGTACGHRHTEDCYKLAEHCIHVHTDDCCPQDDTSDNTATPAGAERREPTECTHRCSEDSGCVKQVLDCRHEHDGECGYTPATEGTPCTYVCGTCHTQEKPQAGQDQCICTEPCTGDKINEDCPVCSEDFAACKGLLPAAPPDALAVTPEQVQEMIDDLPTAEELQAMTKEEQQEVYADLQAAYDAYEALTDGQKAEGTGAGIFESLFGVFNGMINAAAAAGGFEVTGGTSGNDYSYADGVLTINDGAELTISTNGQTSDRIVIDSGAKATVILNGVNIGGTFDNEESAIDVSSGAALNIILQAGSTNTISVDYSKVDENNPGIHVPKDAVLVIQGKGFLSVMGGTGTIGMGSVGIGGKNGKSTWPAGMRGPGEDCGMVVILGKNVEVEGSQGENPIGGGFGFTDGRPSQWDDGQGIRPTDGGSYEVWGSLTLPKYPASYTIPEGVTLTIPDARSLNIPEGITLTNHGTITGDGRLEGVGTLTGDGVVTVSLNLFYDLAEYTVTVETEGQGTASASPASAAMGEIVTLTADAASGYYFKGWEAVAGGVIMNGGRFIMPGENVVVKAVFEKDAGNGGSSGGGRSSSDDSDGSGGSGSPDTWSVPAGTWVRDQTGWWYWKANGTYPVSCWQRLAYQNTAEWYRFDERGYMQTGWFTDAAGRTYYLHAVSDGRQGYMYTGWHQIGGVWYYFREIQDSTEGVLYKNSRTPDGYWVDENGVWEP